MLEGSGGISEEVVEDFREDYVLRVRLVTSRGTVMRIDVSYKPTWSKENPLEFTIEIGDEELVFKRGEMAVSVKDPMIKNIWFKNAREVADELERNSAETVNDIVRSVRAIVGRATCGIEIDY